MTLGALGALLNVTAMVLTLGLLGFALAVLFGVAVFDHLSAKHRHRVAMKRTDSYAYPVPLRHAKARR